MGLSSFPVSNSNPFVVDGIIRVRRSVDDKNNLLLVDESTGDIMARYAPDTDVKYRKFDNEKFVKLYHRNMKALSRMGVTSLKVLFFVMYEVGALSRNQQVDYFSIHIQDCMDFCGFRNRKSVYDGLEELLVLKAIFRKTGKLEFWINPNVFFNGDRVKYMEERAKASGGKGVERKEKESDVD